MSIIRALRWTALLLAALLVNGCDVKPLQTQPKTLIIGMDGVQLQHYEQLGADTNLHKRLFYGKAYAGGITGRAS